jgi:predicted nucleic acid-binding protein
MLKAILDTSILVSAFLKHEGVNAKALRGGKDQYQLYLKTYITSGTRIVLQRWARLNYPLVHNRR